MQVGFSTCRIRMQPTLHTIKLYLLPLKLACLTWLKQALYTVGLNCISLPYLTSSPNDGGSAVAWDPTGSPSLPYVPMYSKVTPPPPLICLSLYISCILDWLQKSCVYRYHQSEHQLYHCSGKGQSYHNEMNISGTCLNLMAFTLRRSKWVASCWQSEMRREWCLFSIQIRACRRHFHRPDLMPSGLRTRMPYSICNGS